MRKIIFSVSAAILFISLASCNLNSGGEYLGSEATAEDLVPMRSLIAGFDAVMALGVEDEDSVDYGIRTIDPYAGNSNTDVEDLIGTSASPKSPETVYGELTGAAGTEKRAPSEGFISDLWGEGNDAYFLISPEGADHYRIKLFTLPRADFKVKYNYEEYLVEDDEAGWGFMNDSLDTNKLTSYKSYLADGTVAVRTIKSTYDGATDNCYADFSVESDILGNRSYYDFPITISEPAHTSAGEWASYTTSVITGKDIDIDEFYTEPTETTYSGVTYISQDFWRSSRKNTVTRFAGDRTAGSETVNSMTVVSNGTSAWQTHTEEISITTVDDKINYTRTSNTWWSGPDSATGDSNSKTVLALEETGVDTNEFSGTITNYWGSLGGSFTVNITQNSNGSYKLRRSGWSFKRRSIASDSDVAVDISLSDNLGFSVEVGLGTFTGNYEQGSFVGTYTIGGISVPVIVDPTGISVEGTHYTFDELVD